MKQMLVLVIIALLACPLFAEEAVLIDFTLLTADEDGQNAHTMMDFSRVAGSSFTADQREVMKTSLAITNWEVVLASSARTVENFSRSYTREATSRGFWGGETTVMGVRIHFPVEAYNSWAIIKPPFEIPAYEPQLNGNGDGIIGRSRFEAQEDGSPAYGVVKNVGTLREVSVWVYGLNFPHSLTTLLIDSQGNDKNLFMGYLNFDGWKQLVWRNPAYIEEVRNRDIRLYPLYPTSTPFVKFGGFMIQRDAMFPGGDFVTYFKEVSVIFDKAIDDLEGRDIDDEDVWRIIQDRETARKVWEMERFGHNQVLRYLEQQRQADELPFLSPDRDQQ